MMPAHKPLMVWIVSVDSHCVVLQIALAALLAAGNAIGVNLDR